MKFTRDYLRNTLDLPCPPGTYEAPAEGDYPSFTVHENTITEHTRWHHERTRRQQDRRSMGSIVFARRN